MATAVGRGGAAFPVEEFVQALSAQLDRAQDALALKARTGRPLTFALKDLAVDLRVFWEAQRDGRMALRHAQPGEEAASTLRLAFTTITRAMVEENTFAVASEDDPRALGELGTAAEALPDEDRRKLELVGVRTVGQLKRMSEGANPKQMEALLDIPVSRLQKLLMQSARPTVVSSEPVRRPDGRQLLRIRGANLATAQAAPQVFVSGEPVEVLEARPSELLVRPMSYHREGALEVVVGAERASGFYEIPHPEPTTVAAPPPLAAPAHAPTNGHGGAPARGTEEVEP